MNETSNAILVKGNKILVGKRPKNKEHYAGLWDVIGGHLETNETPEDAMKREVKEELGVEVIDYKLFDSMKNDVDPTSNEAYNHYFFIVTRWNGNIKNLSDLETLKWIAKKDLNNLEFSPSMRKLLKRVLK